MKEVILKLATGLVTTAVLLSIGTSVIVSNPEIILRVSGISTSLIIGSIGLFFIGAVYPKK